jgi:hypothetical protein
MFGCASSDTVAVRDIANTQLHKIAAAQLAVERHIEQREFALVSGDLEAYLCSRDRGRHIQRGMAAS